MIKSFNKNNYAWLSTVNYRDEPHQYQVGKGEQGVLICEPYKSEILPYWKFKTPAEAKKSAAIIYKLFLNYLAQEEFVGADLARKYLQMGFTRARRYANYKGGRKYNNDKTEQLERGSGEPQKAESARIFYQIWQKAERNPKYKKLKNNWKKTWG